MLFRIVSVSVSVSVRVWYWLRFDLVSWVCVCFVFTPDFTEIHNLYRLFMCSTDWENLMDWFLWWYWKKINFIWILLQYYKLLQVCMSMKIWGYVYFIFICRLFYYYYIYIKFYLCIYTSKLFGSSFFPLPFS